jgi:hypothetical protein
MTVHGPATRLDRRIEEWRAHVSRSRAIVPADADELEDHLREQIERLQHADLSEDEAFLVAVTRMGNLDAVAQEFARAHAERLWTDTVLLPVGPGDRSMRADATVACALALLAASGVTALRALGLAPGDELWPLLGLSFVVLPLMTGYFVWKRRTSSATALSIAGLFLLAGVAVAFPAFTDDAATRSLALLHMPVALLPVLGWAYSGGRWWHVTARVDFIRFLGELCIYAGLMTGVAGVAIAALVGVARVTGARADVELLLLPATMAALALVATWLVETKQGVVERVAPVLARLCSPLLIVLLLGLLVSGAVRGTSSDVIGDFGRTLLLLGLAEACVMVAVASRHPDAPVTTADGVHLVLLIAAALVVGVTLTELMRPHPGGAFTAARSAALGLQIILLVHLGGAALLQVAFIRDRVVLAWIERWHADALTVLTAWAALVVLVLPPAFGYR